jgi:capsular exopolysaccharide synthesis family protein
MGYIFDALKRADGEKGGQAKPPLPSAPPPEALVPPKPRPLTAEEAAVFPQPPKFEAEAGASDSASGFKQSPAEMAAAKATAHESDARPSATTGTTPRLHTDTTCFDDRIVPLISPASVMAEEYRSIRTGILARWQQKRNLIHTITSATPQEGKTLTSLNLGFSFAELRNRRTIVIEADLRLPQFGKLLGLPETPGLVGVLEDGAELEKALLRVGPNGLDVLAAGRRVNDQAVQLLSGATMAALLKRLKEQYDHVIVDTPPVVELADAGILGALSDDVLLIARLQRTPRALIEQAARTLTSYNAPVAGVIATDQKRNRGHYYYKYGYRYGYHYSQRAA